jgi:hypothetical protein
MKKRLLKVTSRGREIWCIVKSLDGTKVDIVVEDE